MLLITDGDGGIDYETCTHLLIKGVKVYLLERRSEEATLLQDSDETYAPNPNARRCKRCFTACTTTRAWLLVSLLEIVLIPCKGAAWATTWMLTKQVRVTLPLTRTFQRRPFLHSAHDIYFQLSSLSSIPSLDASRSRPGTRPQRCRHPLTQFCTAPQGSLHFELSPTHQDARNWRRRCRCICRLGFKDKFRDCLPEYAVESE